MLMMFLLLLMVAVPVVMRMVVVLMVVVPVVMVMVMLMVMVMVVIVMIVQNDVEITSGDAAGTLPRHAVVESLQTEAGKDCVELLPAAAEVEQCGDGHIAADSGCAFEIKNGFHRQILPLCCCLPRRN